MRITSGGIRWSATLAAFTVLPVLPLAASAAGVQARFDVNDRRGGPFPSDRFTVVDRPQITGLRVNLPKPDCAARPNDCQNLDVINTLDGFNVQPRLSIPFDGPIDVSTVTSDTVFLVRLGLASRRGAGARRVGINQVVWDVATNTLHVEADELLDQHTSYALIVTRGIRDALGNPVEPSPAFAKFLFGPNSGRITELKAYRLTLLRGLVSAALFGVSPKDIAVAAVFTTQSVTAVLEKIRDQIKLETPAPADFALGPGGARAVYPLPALTGIQFVQQTRTSPSFTTVTTPFLALSFPAPGVVGALAFGKYLSPVYLTAERRIPLAGTRVGVPQLQGTEEIVFNLFLPAGPPPAGGWPVAIYGHGGGDSKEGGPFIVAATLAAHGIATIAINAVGRGFGPLSTLSLLRGTDTPISLTAGGRGIDINRDGQITAIDGSLALAPHGIIRDRDAKIQTVADLMQLVRVIQVGMDVDGDGVSDLDPSRIYYFGHSFGGNYGGVFRRGAARPSWRAHGPGRTDARIHPLESGEPAVLWGPCSRPASPPSSTFPGRASTKICPPRRAARHQHGAGSDGDPGAPRQFRMGRSGR